MLPFTGKWDGLCVYQQDARTLVGSNGAEIGFVEPDGLGVLQSGRFLRRRGDTLWVGSIRR
jgi:hypothetical protein